jgi:hypothetical protein
MSALLRPHLSPQSARPPLLRRGGLLVFGARAEGGAPVEHKRAEIAAVRLAQGGRSRSDEEGAVMQKMTAGLDRARAI